MISQSSSSIVAVIIIVLSILFATHQHQLVHSAVTWTSHQTTPFKIHFDYRFIDSPTSDVHVTTGLAMTCPGLSNNEVWSSGKASGSDCYDGSGALQFSYFCRLVCQAGESLTAPGISNLKAALTEVATAVRSAPLEVRSDDNTTITFQSDIFTSCDGMKILSPISVSNTNLVIIVTARPLRQIGVKNLFADRTFCNQNQNSARPAVVRLNVDPRFINSYSLPQLKTMLAKEIFHALGFTTNLMPSFRHPDDPTKTYFQQDATKYPTGPISGARIVASTPSADGNFTLGVKSSSKIYFHGPATSAVASAFFSCAALQTTGVEFENGAELAPAIANLEKRIFPNDMHVADWNGTLTATAAELFSRSLTLALLHDTGFFSVPQFRAANYSVSSLKFSGNFGYLQGCTFVQGKCIPDWPQGFSCSELGGGCGIGDVMGQCDIRTYPSALDAAFQYFNDPLMGGSSSLSDYCPQFTETPGGNCRVPLSDPSASSLVRNSGMYFGSSSKCAISRVVSSGLLAPTVSFPSCFPVVCEQNPTQIGAYFVVGNEELIQCSADDAIVELFPPPRANVYQPPLAVVTSGATVVKSYAYHGLIACSSLPTQCANDATSSMPRLAKVNSVITSIYPAWSPLDGGASITITGQRLTNCVGARVGGIPLTNFRIVNDTIATARTGRVPDSGVEGGNNPDAQGDALVQLLCVIPSLASSPQRLCQNGCIVGRWFGLFNYSVTDPNAPAPPPPDKTFFDFFTTPGGKVIGIFLSLITTGIMAVAVRKGMNYFHGMVDDETYRDDMENGKDVQLKRDMDNSFVSTSKSTRLSSSDLGSPLLSSGNSEVGIRPKKEGQPMKVYTGFDEI